MPTRLAISGDIRPPCGRNKQACREQGSRGSNCNLQTGDGTTRSTPLRTATAEVPGESKLCLSENGEFMMSAFANNGSTAVRQPEKRQATSNQELRGMSVGWAAYCRI